jgi:uncharacterized protein DUF4954/uncharacterized protein DUF6819
MEAEKQTSYRLLTQEEQKRLQDNNCTSESWDTVYVKDPFDPARIKSAGFSGDIYLGTFTKTITLKSGMKMPSGIYDAELHNVTVGDNVLIKKINHHIANYDIGNDTVIINTEIITVDEITSFGNGVEAVVINEGGGREIPIYDTLSAHVAYLIALYRHRKRLISNLQQMIQEYSAGKTASHGKIGSHVHINNCQILRNVQIDSHAVLEGVGELTNGTIRSCEEDPSYVGINVIAKDFIICEGGSVSENTIIDHCFIGQATQLSKQYSAENSVFFANCGGYHGEACSVFAGPYTVTHHKSTLLIACLVSFLNAGSGSNQSNHMYKLGPKHQGIIERGSKTGSDSYMLWPMKVGAFTLIMGRHYGNSDTTEFPFSYLIEHDGESMLIPAINLRSIGTIRDSRKWPKRDNRKVPVKFDHLNFHLLSPYTIKNIIAGLKKLREIKRQAGYSTQTYYYNGVKIRRAALEKGIEIYEIAVTRYLGNIVVNFLRANDFKTITELRTILTPQSIAVSGAGAWLDIAGLIAPKDEIESVIHDVEQGTIKTTAELDVRFSEINAHFEQFELAWVMNMIEDKYGLTLQQFTQENFTSIIEKWIKAVAVLDDMRCSDAEKEFAQTARVGYALNDGEAERDAEYLEINGDVNDNDFIIELRERLKAKKLTAEQLIDKISKLEK